MIANKPIKILGIDPGSTRAGYGVILFSHSANPQFIDGGIVGVSSADHNQRLVELRDSFKTIVKKHKPDCAGIEKLYFTKNVKTGIEVAQARGVLIVGVQDQNIPIYEFTPSEIKQGLTGYGAADKKAIETMVRATLHIDDLKQPDDVYDALAVALVLGYSLENKRFQAEI